MMLEYDFSPKPENNSSYTYFFYLSSPKLH